MPPSARAVVALLATLVSPLRGQGAVGLEAGVLTAFGDHTAQAGVRLTELSPRGGVDVLFATFPEAFGDGAIPLLLDLDATLPVAVFPGLFIAPRAGAGVFGATGTSGGGGTFALNVGVGVIGRVAGSVALRCDVTEHRFVQDLSLPFRSFTVGVTWLLR